MSGTDGQDPPSDCEPDWGTLIEAMRSIVPPEYWDCRGQVAAHRLRNVNTIPLTGSYL